MANRYWVYTGVNRQWGSTNEGTWSATSGGAGNASVPTAADDVFFDANSGPAGQTVTFFNPVCKSLNTTGFLGSFAQGGTTLSISGNLVLTKNIPTPALSVRFFGSDAAYTINAGSFLSSHNVQVGGSGNANYTLINDLSCSTFVLKSNSSFASAGFILNITTSLGTETGTSFSPGTSTINCTMLNIVSGTWTSAQNSTINLAASNGLSNSGNSLGTVIVTPTATPCNIVGTGTYVNLTINYPANTQTVTSISGTQTITGTLTLNGADIYSRIQNGTINAANVVISNMLFSGLTAGGAATWTGTNIGAFGSGNSNNIIFSEPVDAICTSSGEWFNTNTWSPRIPLPQDNTIVKTIGSNITLTNTVNGTIYIKALEYQNVSGGTINMQSLGNINIMDGGFTVPAGVTIGSNKPNLFFSSLNNSGNYNISCVPNLVAVVGVFRIWNTSATYNITTDFTASSTFTILSGTLNLADNVNVTFNGLSTSGSIARTINLGINTTINVVGTNTSWDVSGTNLTLNAGTSTIYLTPISSNPLNFNGPNTTGTKTYYNLVFNGVASSLTINGSNTFNNFTDLRTVSHSVYFDGASTNTFAGFSVTGSSGNLVTIDGRTSGSPATFNLVKTGASPVACNFINVVNAQATPATNTWYAGANSFLSGTSGWILANAPGTTVSVNSLFFGSFF